MNYYQGALAAQNACNGIALIRAIRDYLRERGPEEYEKNFLDVVGETYNTFRDRSEEGTDAINKAMGDHVAWMVRMAYDKDLVDDPVIRLYVAQLQWLANGKSVDYGKWRESMQACEEAANS